MSETARSVLRVRFFGHFEMFCGDEVVDLGRNSKVKAILKYLLAHRRRSVSQDHLMGWLWPESNLKRARSSLNSAIYSLRKVLSESPESVLGNYVLFKGGHYYLCPTIPVKTDIDEFDECYEKGRRLQKTGRTEDAAAEYESRRALPG